MQSSTAEKLRQDWGNAFCYHPMFDKEYRSNEYKGNYVCLICGGTVSEEKHKHFIKMKDVGERPPDSEQK